MSYDVLIIGAGVIGGMLARQLSRYDVSVCLLEKENDVARGSSKANSGIVHGGYDPEPGTLKAKLNTVGIEKLFAVAKELSVPCRRNGSMVCAFTQEDEELLQALLQRGNENCIHGLKILNGDEARKMEPNLSPDVTAVLHVPNAGIIGPYELTIAAVGNAMDNGVELLRNFEVCHISRENDRFSLTAVDGRQVYGRYVVNCAGGYSDRIAALVGDGNFTIIPRSGEYMLMDRTEGATVQHTLFQCPSKEGKGILVTPTVHGNLLVGPTATRVESPDCKGTTAAGLADAQRLASKSVPTLNFRQVITSFAGVRSSEKNGDFIIRASDKVPGLIHAAAIDSPGLTCCVSIADYLIQILEKQGLAMQEKKVWNGTRADQTFFQKLTDDEKDAFIKANPSYGKIVCRCETISEGEIRQAIRTNPGARDVDGIKHRTRSGMGRCQGGFCSPYIMEIISNELNIEMEAVTKNGDNAPMLVGRVGEV